MEEKETQKRLMDLEILVNRIQEKALDVETIVKQYPETHKNMCPFSDFKGDTIGKFREIADGMEKCKGEIYAVIAENKKEGLISIENAKKTLTRGLLAGLTIIVVMMSIDFSLSQDKIGTQTFHESISILNKTQERQLEIYERLLQDLNQLKVDTGIIKNKIDMHTTNTQHVLKK